MDGCVVRDSGLHGRGLFAVQGLPALTRVAVYGGHRKLPHHVMRGRKAGCGAESNNADEGEEAERWVELPTSAVIAKLRYLINSYDDAWVLDPTDDEGQVLPECDVPHFAAHCANEPPAPPPARYDDGDDEGDGGEALNSGGADLRFFPNACFVQNHNTQQTEVWTIRAVPPDQEIHVYYGSGVYRDYDVHPQLLLVRNIGLVVDQTGHVRTLQFDGSEYDCSAARQAVGGDEQQARGDLPEEAAPIRLTYTSVSAARHPWLAELLDVLVHPS